MCVFSILGEAHCSFKDVFTKHTCFCVKMLLIVSLVPSNMSCLGLSPQVPDMTASGDSQKHVCQQIFIHITTIWPYGIATYFEYS